MNEIIYTIEDGYFRFFRTNGRAGAGKVQIQVADCKRYPASLSALVWDNHTIINPTQNLKDYVNQISNKD